MNINEKVENTMKYEYFYYISAQLNEINAEKLGDWIGDKLGDKL